MMDKYIARVTELADEMAPLLAEAREAEEWGHEFSQRELRVRSSKEIGHPVEDAEHDLFAESVMPVRVAVLRRVGTAPVCRMDGQGSRAYVHTSDPANLP